MAAYYVGDQELNPIPNEIVIPSEIEIGAINTDKSGRFEIDLSDYIKKAGQYQLIVRSEKNAPRIIESASLILQGIETPGFTSTKPDVSCNVNITAHPSGGKGTIIMTGKIALGKKSKDMEIKFFLKME